MRILSWKYPGYRSLLRRRAGEGAGGKRGGRIPSVGNRMIKGDFVSVALPRSIGRNSRRKSESPAIQADSLFLGAPRPISLRFSAALSLSFFPFRTRRPRPQPSSPESHHYHRRRHYHPRSRPAIFPARAPSKLSDIRVPLGKQRAALSIGTES